MNTTEKNIEWNTRRAAELYGIEEWSSGYFGISPAGEVVVRAPTTEGDATVSLMEIVDGMQQRGLQMPVLLRLENLVDKRISILNDSFAQAIESSGYRGQYRGAFPIKVNQQRHVVAEIARFGERYNHGLEAGSKAELMVALAMLTNRESLIICNGYKDAEFISLGLQARKLGFKCFFVLETLSELQSVIERSRALNIEPLIGVRLKLSTKVEGHWSADSGDRSLFGLNTNELVTVIDTLRDANLLHCFQLLHFHLGSQIPNIRSIRSGVLEACRYYIELVGEGAPLGYLDLGGGLAIDYDGTCSTNGHSRNYSVQEYCIDVVEAIQESLDKHRIPHPVIVTESGRATVAHTSILLFNILDVTNFEPTALPADLPQGCHEMIHNLWLSLASIHLSNLQESYNDVMYYRDKIRDFFHSGDISLRHRVLAENIYLAALQKIASLLPQMKRIPAELESLPQLLADIYYGNFSVFQSLPDSWAIGQVFPVMPIHRLNEEPSRHAIIADLTCDCDGKLQKFASPEGESSTIALHPIKAGEEYYLGVFLVGAYQETLGDLHNLFGDTNVASVRINADASIDFVHEIHGDSIADVLSYVEYEPNSLYQQFRQTAEQAVRDGIINVADRQQMLAAYSEGLRGYTYFEK
ncbi:biosynthetic arginine decarboxylase [Cellvibrio sp. KY-GH-1]|uniref:biosynthetic arginine decarboxylase n=1 Tax=Cellvibrio sp. KY-GH-1 TaxID=2303332 RepID=UPI001247E621|nr:biosynthetic arginine decarboxylase [Cellvibrio sp. KY-GH-1]QEY14823.1 biosynthetic arginine decarboxylase [Cellvibrio sp. KY-GH-1]